MATEEPSQSGDAKPPLPDLSLFTSSNERLSMFFPVREILAIAVSSTSGFALGAAHGGNMTGLRFRAENAHRLPTSEVGWYLYHKSKNYHIMLGGIKEGLRMAGKLGLWSGAFFWMEEAVDRLRGAVLQRWVGFKDRRAEAKGWETVRERDLGLERLENLRGVWVQRDFLSTTVAALGTAGAFSVWNRMPVNAAARMATIALKAGIGFGLVQDVLSLLKGRRVGYVEFLKRNMFGSTREAKIENVASAT